ncbi:hypothetical protein C7444_105159 [Sphaerotilus hippei]|uniref:Nucleotidyltransferase substrate binding protein (TIGR01987 family) n=2 Tax=Sphaerotilus hippei TaxID=744406 RepID=A0A318H6J2_9BURK|nr:hypothetical protein C7444_105159 [Sphaerotilus hippei]
MGERLTVATLASLAEPYEDWPMRDRLHRLEKLGFIDTDDWLRWRALRHRLAHEYPGQDDLRFATLLEGIRGAAELLAACRHWMLQLAAR